MTRISPESGSGPPPVLEPPAEAAAGLPPLRPVLNMVIAIGALIILGCAVLIAGLTRPSSRPDQRPLWREMSRGPQLGVTRQLSSDVALYPRAIRLAHSGTYNGQIIAAVVTHSGRRASGAIFESKDGGASFSPLSTITDPAGTGGKGLCCGTLFEVPQTIGRTAAGTLLWAASTGQNDRPRRMAIRVWKSSDHGGTWSYLSSCTQAHNSGGLWEPELSVDSAGRLVCYFSDETEQPRYSQALARTVSLDGGYTWSRKQNIVASRVATHRPGMAVVRKLPYGIYVMSYEICTASGTRKCGVHFRTSYDGWNWGDPAGLGVRPQATGGDHFEHAPTIAWAPDGGMYGRLILMGQVLTAKGGGIAAGSGRVVLTNSRRGSGPWTEVPAPVAVPIPDDDERTYDQCSNYSSALLPSADGRQVLGISTRHDADGVCRAYYATGRLS
jgi:hypothetical protein